MNNHMIHNSRTTALNVAAMAIVALLLAAISNVLGDVPGIISYQGRVTVDGTNFTGTGWFKFAIDNGNSVSWANDGSVVDEAVGAEPTNGVPLTVSQGLFAVNLGDTSVSNMTASILPGTFAGSARYLRVWFSADGTNFTALSPITRITASGYALNAANAEGVSAGAITGNSIANSAITTAHLASDAVTSVKIADGTITGSDLSSSIAISTSGNITSGGLNVDSGTLYVDAANNRVGISTTTPSVKLDIVGNSSGTNDALRLRAGNASNSNIASQVLLSQSGGTNYTHSIKSRHNAGSDTGNAIDFYVWNYGTDAAGDVGTLQALTVTASSSGPRVGVGTASPTVALDVNGTANASSFTGNSLNMDSGTLYVNATSSRVGVGTLVPVAKLDIASDNSGTNDALRLRSGNASNSNVASQVLFSQDGGSNYTHSIKTRHNAGSDGGNAIDFYLWNYGTDASSDVGTMQGMTIVASSSGPRVGVGISSPTVALDVNGAAKATSFSGDGSGLTGIGASSLISNSVTSAKIADSAVIAAKIADNSVTSAKIADNSVTSAKIVDGAITGSDLSSSISIITSGAINTDVSTVSNKLTAGYAEIGNTNSVPLVLRSSDDTGTSLKLENGAVGGRNWSLVSSAAGNAEGGGRLMIKDNNANAVRMVVGYDGNVGIGTNAPQTPLHVVGTVTATAFNGDGSGLSNVITSVADGSITSARLANNSVISDKIADGNVTSAKIADDSITALKIADDSVTTDKIASGAITGSKFASDISITTSGNVTSGGLNVNGGTLFVDTTNNRVGIGTTSPTVALDVNGTVRATTILSGSGNTLNGSYSVMGGGAGNTSTGFAATVAGGYLNVSTGTVTTVGGGYRNVAGGFGATIAGGEGNSIDIQGGYSFVGGGQNNAIHDSWAVIAGGYANNIQSGSDYGFIGGGLQNTNSGPVGTIAGGLKNTVGYIATIGGGQQNSATGSWATVAGGLSNSAGGREAFVGGGQGNTASGTNSVVAGGYGNTASGDYSMAAGRRAKAVNNGSFVWADSTDADFSSTGTNQFLIRASGGVGIGTNNPQTALHVVGTVTATAFSGDGSGLTGVIATNAYNTSVSLSGTTLNVTDGGGTKSVSLASFTNSSVSLSGTTLNVANGFSTASADLSTLQNVYKLVRSNSTTTAVHVDSSGRVGIATTSPGATLDVDGYARFDGDIGVILQNSASTSEGGQLKFNDANATNVTQSGGWNLDVYNTNTLRLFRSDVGTKLIIQTNGNVGIGTTSPSSKLDVNGTVTADAFSGPFSGTLSVDCTNNQYAATLTGSNTAGTWFTINNAYGRTWQFISTSTNNGEGTGKLLIRDGLSNAVRILINTNGFVGIGTNSPTERLEVTGNIRCTGTVTANGTVLTSDRNLKKDIAPLGESLGKVMALKPATYRFKSEAGSEAAHVGFIAQEVQQVFPDAVKQSGDHLALSYTDLSVAGIKALQELKREKDEQIEALKAMNAALLERLEALEQSRK